MNLLLITVDCLRADHVGFMGYRRPTTPNLDTLAGTGIVFEQGYTAGTPTYYAFPPILASRYPLSYGRDILGMPPGSATLASALKRAGYSTAGFVAGNLYISRWFGYHSSFDVWEDFASDEELARAASRPDAAEPVEGNGQPLRRKINNTLGRFAGNLPAGRQVYEELYFRYAVRSGARKYAADWSKARQYPTAQELTSRALAWLNTQNRTPFFLWLHYMDPHQPRYPSAQALAAVGAARCDPQRQFLLNNIWLWRDAPEKRFRGYLPELGRVYDAGIREVDDQIGLLLKGLERLRVAENTGVCMLADHGEEFLEHGSFGHTHPKLFEELLHIPVLIHWPGRMGSRRVRSLFSTIDLAPTLLDAVGLPAPSRFQGQSRWREIEEGREWSGPIISEAVNNRGDPWKPENRSHPRLLAVRDGQHKLILNFEDGSELLFDLASDPGERRPLGMEENRGARARLIQSAREHLRQTRRGYDGAARVRGRLAELLQRELKANAG